MLRTGFYGVVDVRLWKNWLVRIGILCEELMDGMEDWGFVHEGPQIRAVGTCLWTFGPCGPDGCVVILIV